MALHNRRELANSPSARFLRDICEEDSFSRLQEEVKGGNGGGMHYSVTKEKLTHMALSSLSINVVHEPGTYPHQHAEVYQLCNLVVQQRNL
jgi:hypothetical protein